MIIVLLGASSSGKSTLELILHENYGYKKIISYTTRQPRANEKNGKDYHFVTKDVFEETIDRGLFAEWEEQTQERFYGTLKKDYQKGDKVVVLTPNGLRQLKKSCPNEDIFSVYVNASLGSRIKRYIDRCGVNKFDFDDKNEISSRVDRDFGMLLGIEKEVDLVVSNNDGEYVIDLARMIHKKCQESK